ncbi:MAG: hypothetical protein J6X44_14370, partial [Thermoguttaceae bacterium]|nr:hypothetical protein [Thermoguttaceae bacterium]
MNGTDSKTTFLQLLQVLEQFLSSEMKKEFKALIDLMQTLHVDSIRHLSKQIVDFQNKIRKSPEGLSARIQNYLGAKNDSRGSEDSVESLTNDFKKLPSAGVKVIAKKYDLNLSTSKDAELFAEWLQTGTRPPTKEELLKQDLDDYIKKTLQLRDRDHRNLSEETTSEILQIAEDVFKKHKIAGLKEYMVGLGLDPQGKTKATLINQIKSHLGNLALSRFKMFTNLEQSRNLENL